MVVSRNTKDLVEIIKELDEYFLKAADAGAQLSLLLEVPTFSQNKGGKSNTKEVENQSNNSFLYQFLFIIHSHSSNHKVP